MCRVRCTPGTSQRVPERSNAADGPFSAASCMRRPLKRAQMQGGARCEVRDVLRPYVAAPRERANAAGGPFSAAC
jgi:hypothetical protein